VETLLQQLLAVSLVEQYETQGEQTTYQLAALVRSWLLANGVPQPTPALLQAAAEFLLWQLENGLNTTWEHRLATHAALLAANLTEQGQRLVLKWIVGPLNRAGMYRTLLDDWLPPLAEADNQQIKGEALGQIGEQYFHIGQYDTALDFLKKSLAIQQEIGDKSGEGTTLNNMATTAHARGDYDTALDFLKKSLAIFEEIGDKAHVGGTLNNISQIYDARGDYDTALDFLKKSLAIQQEIGDKSSEGTTLNNISQIFKARGDYDTALDFLKKSLAIQQEIGDVAGLCATLFNMGHIHLQNEEVAEAVQAWVTVYEIGRASCRERVS
jgi:tetratricopeptide (TPR) repeat protein